MIQEPAELLYTKMTRASEKMKAGLLSIILSVSIILSSCISGEEEMGITISPEDKTIIQLAKTRYSNDDLEEIAAFEGLLEEYNERYPIQCIRDKETFYRVTYLGDDSIASILFEKTGEKIIGGVIQQNQTRAVFQNVQKGLSVGDIFSLDPRGNYVILETGRGEPRISIHNTEDGFVVLINYDTSGMVESIMIEPQ